MGGYQFMIDLTDTLDSGTDFPSTWKTLVRELLLKFEDGCTYHHDNIVGNRPFHVDLKITIDEPVDEPTEKQLHMQAKDIEESYNVMNELLDAVYNSVQDLSPEDGIIKLKQITEKIKHE